MVQFNVLLLSAVATLTQVAQAQETRTVCLFPGQDSWKTDIKTEHFDKTAEEFCKLAREEGAVTKAGMDPLGIFRSHAEGAAVWTLTSNWESDCDDETEFNTADPTAELPCEVIWDRLHTECSEEKDSRGGKLYIGECAFWRYEAV